MEKMNICVNIIMSKIVPSRKKQMMYICKVHQLPNPGTEIFGVKQETMNMTGPP